MHEHEIVKYHNRLNNFNYGRFSAVEADIFFSLVSKIRSSNGTLIMTFDELRKLTADSSRKESQFVNSIEQTFSKYLNLKYREDDGTILTLINVFQRLDVDRKKKIVTVTVTPGMEECVMMVSENFTRFELKEFTKLKSSYSKSLYRLLKQWRTVGELRISIEEFRFKLDVPKSYRMTNIDKIILNPAVEELAAYFENLKVSKQYSKSTKGQGRPSVSGFIFTFKPEIVKAEASTAADHQERIAASSEWEKTPRFCPKCHRPIYAKPMENENGMYTLYGHLDWKTGPCQYTTTHFEDLLEERQVKELEEKNEPLTAELEANRSKLSAMLKNMFKSS